MCVILTWHIYKTCMFAFLMWYTDMTFLFMFMYVYVTYLYNKPMWFVLWRGYITWMCDLRDLSDKCTLCIPNQLESIFRDNDVLDLISELFFTIYFHIVFYYWNQLCNLLSSFDSQKINTEPHCYVTLGTSGNLHLLWRCLKIGLYHKTSVSFCHIHPRIVFLVLINSFQHKIWSLSEGINFLSLHW